MEAYLESIEALHERLDEGMSWSGGERNCVFLNTGGDDGSGRRFANLSSPSGLDFADDGRGVAVFDWDQDGDLDLAFANRTAPHLRLMRNATPAADFVAFELEGDGTRTNRDAIGARIVLETSAGDIVRTLRAGEGFLSQSSKWVHFGLGASRATGRVTVRWPGGEAETFDGVEARARYRLVQGAGRAARVTSSPRQTTLLASSQEAAPATTGERVVLAVRPPLPRLTLQPFESNEEVPVAVGSGRPLLVNLWASWCVPCRGELLGFAREAGLIRSAGLDVVALGLDGLGEDAPTTAADGRRFMAGIDFPFQHGLATAETVDKVEIVERYLFDRKFPLALPLSILIDRHGGVAALYRGGLEPAALVRDLELLEAAPADLLRLSVPLPGRWFDPPHQVSIVSYARWFEDRFPEEAIALLQRAVEESGAALDDDAAKRYARGRARHELLEAWRELGRVERKRGNLDAAASHYRSALAVLPDDAEARAALSNILWQSGAVDQLAAQLETWLEEEPGDAELHGRLASAYERRGEVDAAARELQVAVSLRPDDANLRLLLGRARARQRLMSEALEQLGLAVELEPGLTEAHVLMAFSLLAVDLPHDAMGHFEHALELEPGHTDARHGLARTYLEVGRVREAVDQYRTLLEERPESASAHHELGVALLEAGERSEGLEHVRQAYMLDGSFMSAANRVAWMLATHPEAAMRDGAAALRMARELDARAQHEQPSFLDTLAAALAETGDYDEAARTLATAIRLATEAGRSGDVAPLRARLELYRSRRPYRDTTR